VNLVTRSLLDRIADPALAEFALAWDELEELIVQTYRRGDCPPEDARRLTDLRRSLQRQIEPLEHALEPHWRPTRIDGEPVGSSPFREILAVDPPEAFIGNWHVLRLLPAAREALNHLLLESAGG